MKYLILTLSFFIHTVVFGQNSNSLVFLDDFKEAKEIAEIENKYIFVAFWADWSAECKMMDREIFTDPEVVSYLSKKYVPVKVDVDKRGSRLAYKSKLEGMPTVIFYDSYGDEVHRVFGYMDKNQFLIAGERAFRNPKKQGSVFRKLYRKERNNPVYLKDYIKFAEANQDYELVDDLANQYMRQIKRIDSVEWMDFVMTYAYDYNSKAFKTLKDNAAAFNNLYGVEEVNHVFMAVFIHKTISESYRLKASSIIKDVDKLIFKHKLYKFEKVRNLELCKALFDSNLEFSEEKGKLEEALASIEYADELDDKLLPRIAAYIVVHSNELADILKIDKIVESKYSQEPTVYYYDLKSIILYKRGLKEESYKAVADAQRLASQLNQAYKSSLASLNKKGMLD